MSTRPIDVGQVRFENALALFDEFVQSTVKHPDAATLRGLERRFAERVLIQPSYWSQIKSRSRQIGERLARQFEQCCHKPHGWMDQPHGTGTASAAEPPPSDADASLPQDDDERFIVGLVLTYYRRHPQRARTRLLDLLGEVLAPAAAAAPAPPEARASETGQRSAREARESEAQLWQRSQAGVAPLKRKR